jgi:hypothetical protein
MNISSGGHSSILAAAIQRLWSEDGDPDFECLRRACLESLVIEEALRNIVDDMTMAINRVDSAINLVVRVLHDFGNFSPSEFSSFVAPLFASSNANPQGMYATLIKALLWRPHWAGFKEQPLPLSTFVEKCAACRWDIPPSDLFPELPPWDEIPLADLCNYDQPEWRLFEHNVRCWTSDSPQTLQVEPGSAEQEESGPGSAEQVESGLAGGDAGASCQWFSYGAMKPGAARLLRLVMFAFRLFPTHFEAKLAIDHFRMKAAPGRSVTKLTTLWESIGKDKSTTIQTSTLHGFLAKHRQWVESVMFSTDPKAFRRLMDKFKSHDVKEADAIAFVSGSRFCFVSGSPAHTEWLHPLLCRRYNFGWFQTTNLETSMTIIPFSRRSVLRRKSSRFLIPWRKSSAVSKT